MASEDVIELGSSDDEALPPPPRNKPQKVAPGLKVKPIRKLNAMVNIPQKIHNVTIKPTKSAKSSTNQISLPGQSFTPIKILPKGTVNNQTTITSLQAPKRVVIPSKQIPIKNSYPVLKSNDSKNAARTVTNLNNKKTCINPLNYLKNYDPSQIVINKVTGSSKTNVAVVKSPTKWPNPIGQVVRSPHPVVKLPPSVTITKTQGGTKRPLITNVTSLSKKVKISSPRTVNMAPKQNIQILNHKSATKVADDPLRVPGGMLTLELDNETTAASTSTSRPQWYVRPEDQTNEEPKELEKQNNKEPDTSKFIEICIEDSPVSKPKNRRASEIDSAILIEDSPVRHGTPKKPAADSDSENDDQRHKTPKKQRRKLDYSVEVPILQESIEIELEPMDVEAEGVGNNEANETNEVETSKDHVTTEAGKEEAKEVDNDAVIEICESPAKTNKGPPRIESSKHSSKKKLEEKSADVEVIITQDEEFHPVYQQFINLCFKLDNSDDMKIIVEKKIKGYHRQVPKEYTHSEEFIDMVSSKIVSMKAGKEKMYLYIKDIVDELNLQRKMAKTELLKKEAERKESGKLTFTNDSEFDSKRQRQIRKLEKTIGKLHRAIKKLEEQEVDFEDEEDSVYLLTERYKERMVRVHAKLCQLTNTKLPSEPRVHIESRPGQPAGPAKRLEKWINKKVPMGKPLPFPDFHDVLRIVREANSEDKLGWNEADIMEEARDLFTRCGKKLQRRRQEVEWRIAASRLQTDVDPAEDNDELKTKLERNRLLASKKEIDVFDKYAERQREMKLEGEEIGDKEADESPLESEDDDVIEESSALSDKVKRKQRLKRLIQERSHKKTSEHKDDSPITIEEDHVGPELSADMIIDVDKDPLEVTENAGQEAKDTEPENKDKKPKTNDENTETEERQPKSTKNEADKVEHEKDDKEPETAAETEAVLPMDTDETERQIMDKESDEAKTQSEKKDNEKENNAPKEAIESKSGDEIEINSDSDVSEVDELHLLKKLYSESENNSSGDSSDSDSPIDISDAVDSDDAKENNVISIENSSESDTRDSNPKDDKDKTELSVVIEEIDSSNDVASEPQIHVDTVENDDGGHDPLEMDSNKMNDDCMNLSSSPDPISNDETVSNETKEIMKSSEPKINDEIEESLECVMDSIDRILDPTSGTNVKDNTDISSQPTEEAHSNVEKEKCGLQSENISTDETVIQATVVEENCVKANETDKVNCENITEKDDAETGNVNCESITEKDFAETDKVNCESITEQGNSETDKVNCESITEKKDAKTDQVNCESVTEKDDAETGNVNCESITEKNYGETDKVNCESITEQDDAETAKVNYESITEKEDTKTEQVNCESITQKDVAVTDNVNCESITEKDEAETGKVNCESITEKDDAETGNVNCENITETEDAETGKVNYESITEQDNAKTDKVNCVSITEKDDVIMQNGAIETTLSISTHDLPKETADNDADELLATDKNNMIIEQQATA